MYEDQFEEWYKDSYILKWIDHDKNIIRDVFKIAFGRGRLECWREVSTDRDLLCKLIEDLDKEEELKEQERLRSGG